MIDVVLRRCGYSFPSNKSSLRDAECVMRHKSRLQQDGYLYTTRPTRVLTSISAWIRPAPSLDRLI